MKKIYIAFSLLAIFFTSLSFFSSCSNDNDDLPETSISVSDLPQAAQTFLQTYFPDYTVENIEMEKDGDIEVFDVELQDGYEVVFNSMGEWTEVDAPFGKTIPAGIVPDEIQNTLNQEYPGYGVTEINSTGQGYKVGLTNGQGGDGISLFFNMSGQIISTEE